MKNITIYDEDAEIIEQLAEENDVSEADIIALFMEYLEEVKNELV